MLWNHTDCLTSILILFIKNKKYVFNIYVPMVFYSFLRAIGFAIQGQVFLVLFSVLYNNVS